MNLASNLEAYMLTLVNEVRAEHDLAPLTLEMNLNLSADVHTAWMIAADTFSHTGDGGSSASERIRAAGFDIGGSWSTGENLAAQTVRGAEGLFDDVYDLHVSLMDSPGHRANILSDDYTHIGIGIAVGPLSYDTGSFYDSILVTQNFGRTGGAVDQHLIGGAQADRFTSLWGDDHIVGAGGNDLITAAGGRDTVIAGDGNDTVHAGDGNDLVRGGSGNDMLIGNSGSDTMTGDWGSDLLVGGFGNDVMRGGVHQDTLIGGWGHDRMFGDAGFDTLRGGGGNDWISGGAQEDKLYGEDGNDTLIGNRGFDRLFGGSGDDVLLGGDAGDGLVGQLGNDTLRGHDGNDRIWGGAGFDLIDGGTGNDVMFGNGNADTFVFADATGGFGNDTIRDFAATNPSERIDLSRVGAIQNFADLMTNHAAQSGSNVLIDAGDNSTILLQNVVMSDLDTSDFIF